MQISTITPVCMYCMFILLNPNYLGTRCKSLKPNFCVKTVNKLRGAVKKNKQYIYRHCPNRREGGQPHFNKNARRPKEAHIAQHLKGIDILDRTGVDLKEWQYLLK